MWKINAHYGHHPHPGGDPRPDEPSSGIDYPQSPMLSDIAALQYMYGADYATRNTNTIYSWDPLSGTQYINGVGQVSPVRNRVFQTVWDGGGSDTYDLSNYTNGIFLDLRPGAWSTISGPQLAYLGDSHFARGNIANAFLYQNNNASLIENAVGGSGNDTLAGNAVGNRLIGNSGRDTLIGFGGSDVETGGGGGDIFRGTAAELNTDTITDFSYGDRIHVTNGNINNFSISSTSTSVTFNPDTAGGGATFTVNFASTLPRRLVAQADTVFGGVDIKLFNPVASDINNSGTPDVLMRSANGSIINWVVQNSTYQTYNSIGNSQGYGAIGTGDINGDGTADIFLQNGAGNIITWKIVNGGYAGFQNVGNPASAGYASLAPATSMATGPPTSCSRTAAAPWSIG